MIVPGVYVQEQQYSLNPLKLIRDASVGLPGLLRAVPLINLY